MRSHELQNSLTRRNCRLFTWTWTVIWMFHDRNVNNKINKIHERALRIAFKDTSSNFEELLIKAASVTIHQKNQRLLTTEIYKTKHDLNPKFMGEIFVEQNI